MSKLKWYGDIRYKSSIKKYIRSFVEEVLQEWTKMNKGKGERRYVRSLCEKKQLKQQQNKLKMTLLHRCVLWFVTRLFVQYCKTYHM